MRVFVTGASGFIGSAIVQDLLAAGHEVLGLARSEASAAKIVAAGARAHRGALDDPESLRKGVEATDGVIHTAFIHDFANMAQSGLVDTAAIEAIGAALAGSGRPFVVTSATALLPAGRLATEADTSEAATAGAYRAPSDRATHALAAQNVRVSLVRLPPSVHGDGDHGFVPGLVAIARDKRLSAYVGEGENRWPAVHRLDVATLYRLALEKGRAGATYHGVAEEGVPTRAIAEMIGRRLGLPVASRASADAAAHFGWLAKFFALDNPTSSQRTREELGWTPVRPGLIADLEEGTYFG